MKTKLKDGTYIVVDVKNKFFDAFNPVTSEQFRSDMLDNNGDSTNTDSFQRVFPSLLDIGIMGKCQNANVCPVDCYQSASNEGDNMKLELFKKIIDEASDYTYQVALGGAGSPNEHPDFEAMLDHCIKNEIVPNYTTSGINLTDDMVEISKKCGAVAVSWYKQPYTYQAIEKFITAGIRTNIHYVLSNESIDEALDLLKDNSIIPDGINAVIFLLYKPVGRGVDHKVLQNGDSRVKEFYSLVTDKHKFEIGLDACNMPGLINNTHYINAETVTPCDGGSFSAYINSNGIMTTCSFDQDLTYGIDINDITLMEAWNSDTFSKFRDYHSNACPSCKDRHLCYGGCPITPSINLCDREERSY